MISSSPSLYERRVFASSHLNQTQLQMDALLDNFSQQASDPKMLLAFGAAGLAFRLTRMGGLALASSLSVQTGTFLPSVIKATSYVAALGSESAVFTGFQRAFREHSPETFQREFLQSFISLSSLRLFGKFSEQQNIFIQHFFTDIGVVVSHQIAQNLHLEENSDKNFYQQLLEAEVMNWQMQAGISLLHSFLPALPLLEKSLDLNIQARVRENPLASDKVLPLVPVMSAARAETLPFHGGKRARGSIRLGLSGRIMRTATRTQPHPEEVPCHPAFLKQRWLAKLPHSLRERIREYGKDYGVVFIPGMLNHAPDPDWMNQMSAAFGKGGLVISAAMGRDEVQHHSLYSIVGENTHVLQPHWEIEVALIIRRLAQSLQHPRIFKGVDKLVIVGHSKGGLLNHALQVISENYHANGGFISPHLHDLYPGLDAIHPETLRPVMEVLRRSHSVLLGSPVEGVDYSLPVQIVDYLLLEGSAHGFDPRRLADYFNRAGLSADEVGIVIHTKMPGLLESLGNSYPGTRLNAFAYKVTGAMFYGISFLVRARNGDALVKKPQRTRHYEMRGHYNHVDIIVDPRSAAEVVEVVYENISNIFAR